MRDNIGDGKFIPKLSEEDDARYVLTKRKESIVTYLEDLLDTLNEFDMFVRVGVSSTYDTGEDFLMTPMSESLRSEKNFILAKRLGECIREEKVEELRKNNENLDIPQEDYSTHTIIISNEAWRKIWGKRCLFGKPISAEIEVEIGRTIHIFPKVPKDSKFLFDIPQS